MKKEYVKPQMVAVRINQREYPLCASNGSGYTINSDAFKSTTTKSNGTGRSRGCDWDDEEDW